MQPLPDDQQSVSPTAFLTEQGRQTLVERWKCQPLPEGAQSPEPPSDLQQMDRWLRWCIAQHILDPRKRLPPYEKLGELFSLNKKHVAKVVMQLRLERLLPQRKTRSDKYTARLKDRDRRLLIYIGEMRAVRFDQARRLLARWSPQGTKTVLSISRTWEIIDRWTDPGIRFLVYRRVFHGLSGWIHPTNRGLREAGLSFRAERPSKRLLDHLYWITEVRMKLEEEHPTITWISERSILAQYEQRHEGQHLPHIPDGILVCMDEDGIEQQIDIEVQISRPATRKVREVMREQFWGEGENNPLRYYVNRLSRKVVRSTYQKMREKGEIMRPSIEIIDLAEWLQVADTAEEW